MRISLAFYSAIAVPGNKRSRIGCPKNGEMVLGDALPFANASYEIGRSHSRIYC
ncbi:hypothetical protein [Nostoc sp.]|uniref:hypothetical protein n=1 Tax=Nostoc sp. TaxID=1180 RepID=UPI002FFBA6FF